MSRHLLEHDSDPVPRQVGRAVAPVHLPQRGLAELFGELKGRRGVLVPQPIAEFFLVLGVLRGVRAEEVLREGVVDPLLGELRVGEDAVDPAAMSVAVSLASEA